jgi:O-antigen/teichoic acid export membrane protein
VTLADVPTHQRQRLLSGMRWSLWLSALAVPFSAAINLLLARVGPETIGVYGLLSVYIGMITAFVYFGGDTVIVHFIPECRREERASFLLSYLLLVAVLLVLWLGIAYCFPSVLHLALGKTAPGNYQLLLLSLAPITIAYGMVIATLKGMLEIRFSQILSKTLPVLSMLAYGSIYLGDRSVLLRHPSLIVWGTYFGLVAFLTLVGALKLIRLCDLRRLRFNLPGDFWRYAFTTHQVGICNFLTGRLDYILILNFGGLAIMGQYVAVMSIAATVILIHNFFMDTLLPSLSNMIAGRNDSGAAQVFIMHMRILFLITTTVGGGIMLLGAPITDILGSQYHFIRVPIVLMTMFLGVAAPGIQGGTILACVGLQFRAVWASVLHLLVFIGLFFALWHPWGLTGAVCAYGLAALIGKASLMAIALRSSRIFPSVAGLWLKAALVQLVVCMIAVSYTPGLLSGTVIWVTASAAFLWLSDYQPAEMKALAETFLPVRLLSQRGLANATAR